MQDFVQADHAGIIPFSDNLSLNANIRVTSYKLHQNNAAFSFH